MAGLSAMVDLIDPQDVTGANDLSDAEMLLQWTRGYAGFFEPVRARLRSHMRGGIERHQPWYSWLQAILTGPHIPRDNVLGINLQHGEPAALVTACCELVAVLEGAFPSNDILPPDSLLQSFVSGITRLAKDLSASFPRGNQDPHVWAREVIAATNIVVPLRRTGTIPTFTEVTGLLPREGIQTLLSTLSAERVMVVEDLPRSGKMWFGLTYALILSAIGKTDGFFWACETRQSVLQIHGTVSDALANYLGRPAGVALALPFERRVDGHDYEDPFPPHAWAVNANQRFMAPTFAVGTLEQAYKAIIPGEDRHIRMACLARQLLVIDGMYLSDGRFTGLTQVLAKHVVALGGYVLVLTSSLDEETLAGLLAARHGRDSRQARLERHAAEDEATSLARNAVAAATSGTALPSVRLEPYPRLAHGSTRHRVTGEDNRSISFRTWDRVEQEAFLREAGNRARKGRKVVVVTNTWRECLDYTGFFEREYPDTLLSLNGYFTCLSTNYTTEDRRAIDEALRSRLEGHHPLLIVATRQVAEGTPYFRFDDVFSHVAPMDHLLRRSGCLRDGVQEFNVLTFSRGILTQRLLEQGGEEAYGVMGVGYTIGFDPISMALTNDLLLDGGVDFAIDNIRETLFYATDPRRIVALDPTAALSAVGLSPAETRRLEIVQRSQSQRRQNMANAMHQLTVVPNSLFGSGNRDRHNPEDFKISRQECLVYFEGNHLSPLGQPMRRYYARGSSGTHRVTLQQQGSGYSFTIDGRVYTYDQYGGR